MEGSPSKLGPGAFVELKEYSYRENLTAMQSVRFLRPCCEDDQHLDIVAGRATSSRTTCFRTCARAAALLVWTVLGKCWSMRGATAESPRLPSSIWTSSAENHKQ
ncbi:hypothetical protein HPB48_025862 [Haemaphysalis longicornis]|uniref:Uncharacterized protein n=1 Tax=Haemaphysalis longicornis TaxID=44386 RepID=A0A9J6H8B6_HAELO|nr:hypothetical protein HPB48_025862 [Haemaphysalis longicornis]